MQFTTFLAVCASLAVLPHVVRGDWDLYTSQCATGLDLSYDSDDFDGASVSIAGQGPCGGFYSDYADEGFSSANPCGDGSEQFDYAPTGDQNFDVRVQGGDGTIIGSCGLTERTITSCDGVTYSCANNKELNCRSSYCN